ncbi:hypothetical protein Cfor_09306 [Coptotermes formosanus]|uniref:Globin domain-containing protein n=1 Tax=Coptotermes formosanus TaxID=36987 RepID=A0A6L2PD32_COPFO|nr:hypothetical protein Cfor_09306 [Coptotermes formosanus]
MSAQKDDANLDTPDPTTGLTPRQRQFVVDTWGVVKPNAKEAGVEMFTRLFEAHPQYQKLFPNFEGLTLSELRTSKKLAAHATNVMYSLASVIDNLDDPECLKELLIKLGKNHGRRPRIGADATLKRETWKPADISGRGCLEEDSRCSVQGYISGAEGMWCVKREVIVVLIAIVSVMHNVATLNNKRAEPSSAQFWFRECLSLTDVCN